MSFPRCGKCKKLPNLLISRCKTSEQNAKKYYLISRDAHNFLKHQIRYTYLLLLLYLNMLHMLAPLSSSIVIHMTIIQHAIVGSQNWLLNLVIATCAIIGRS